MADAVRHNEVSDEGRERMRAAMKATRDARKTRAEVCRPMLLGGKLLGGRDTGGEENRALYDSIMGTSTGPDHPKPGSLETLLRVNMYRAVRMGPLANAAYLKMSPAIRAEAATDRAFFLDCVLADSDELRELKYSKWVSVVVDMYA